MDDSTIISFSVGLATILFISVFVITGDIFDNTLSQFLFISGGIMAAVFIVLFFERCKGMPSWALKEMREPSFEEKLLMISQIPGIEITGPGIHIKGPELRPVSPKEFSLSTWIPGREVESIT